MGARLEIASGFPSPFSHRAFQYIVFLANHRLREGKAGWRQSAHLLGFFILKTYSRNDILDSPWDGRVSRKTVIAQSRC
jgi:hypothetical protein